MAPTHTNQKGRPSLLAPEDEPDKRVSNTTADRVDPRSKPRRPACLTPVAAGIVAITIIAALLASLMSWHVTNDDTVTMATAKPADTARSTLTSRTLIEPSLSDADRSRSWPQQTAARIISSTDPKAVNRSHDDIITQPDTIDDSKSAKSAATPAFVTRSGKPAMHEIDTASDPAPETEIRANDPYKPPLAIATEQQPSMDIDVAIMATLMALIKKRDIMPNMAGFDSNRRPLLQQRLRSCPAGNTIEGIECRQQICRNYTAATDACPKPD